MILNRVYRQLLRLLFSDEKMRVGWASRFLDSLHMTECHTKNWMKSDEFATFINRTDTLNCSMKKMSTGIFIYNYSRDLRFLK